MHVTRPTNRLCLAVFLLGCALIVAVGTWLRVPDLAARPMHVDEAVQGMVLQKIWQKGEYRYDPTDLHGPVLVMSAFPLIWASGAKEMGEVSEVTLRMTTVCWGLILIGITLGAWRWLGILGALFAAGVVAVSPMMTFYSRYFIMEMPLVVLLTGFFLCTARYFESGKFVWIAVGATLVGLMHMTKETFVIPVAAFGIAIFATAALERLRHREQACLPFLNWQKLLGGVAIALLISAALVSLFFRFPQAIWDSYLAYWHYFQRADGAGHEQPWGYYWQLLWGPETESVRYNLPRQLPDWAHRFVFTWLPEPQMEWSEAVIPCLAGLGILAAIFFSEELPRRLRWSLRTFAVYAPVSFLIYSFLSYKTPWSILSTHHALTILAGLGLVAIAHQFAWLPLKGLLWGLATWSLFPLVPQSQRANFPLANGRIHDYANESRNPYLYAQTSPSVTSRLLPTIEQAIANHPEGKNLAIMIIDPTSGWPLPWYLRKLPRVGYFRAVPSFFQYDVVIVESNFDELVAPVLGDGYNVSTINPRVGVTWYCYVKKQSEPSTNR